MVKKPLSKAYAGHEKRADSGVYSMDPSTIAPLRCATAPLMQSSRVVNHRAIHMPNVPNLITLFRLAMVPLLAWLLLRESYTAALLVFMAAALSDALDGFIARRYGLASTLGATLDPIADKLAMLVTTVLLAWHGLLPLWLAVAIVARDMVIVAGAIAYRLLIGALAMTPTRLSKINTTLEFAVLLFTMAVAAQWIGGGTWLTALFSVVGATVVASGAQYVWIWGRKAAADRSGRSKA